MQKLRPVAYELCGLLAAKAELTPDEACRKATRRSIKALGPPTPGVVLMQADIQRRWIRGKCARCAKCPDMVF